MALLGFRRPEQETAALGVAEGRTGDKDDALTSSTGEPAQQIATEDKPEYHCHAQQDGVERFTVRGHTLSGCRCLRWYQHRFEGGKGGAAVRLLLHQIRRACRV